MKILQTRKRRSELTKISDRRSFSDADSEDSGHAEDGKEEEEMKGTKQPMQPPSNRSSDTYYPDELVPLKSRERYANIHVVCF